MHLCIVAVGWLFCILLCASQNDVIIPRLLPGSQISSGLLSKVVLHNSSPDLKVVSLGLLGGETWKCLHAVRFVRSNKTVTILYISNQRKFYVVSFVILFSTQTLVSWVMRAWAGRFIAFHFLHIAVLTYVSDQDERPCDRYHWFLFLFKYTMLSVLKVRR